MTLTKKKFSNYIPHDISYDILSKLSMKTLKRFTCVCKFWANLFENPQFISMFRNNLLLPKYDDYHTSRLLLKKTPAFTEDHDDDNYIFLLSGETFENSVKLNWPPPFEEYRREDLFIFGSVVNGILCLYQGNGNGNTARIVQNLVLWNPYTEEFKVIPSGSFERTILKAFPHGSVFEDLPLTPTFVNIHGFGYDSVTDDYKLIRYFCICNDVFKHGPNDQTLWQVYSLKSNYWRDLQVEMPNHSRYNGWQDTGYSVNFHGMCHWWGYEDYFGDQVLVSFNLSDENFVKTPFPLSQNYDKFAKHLVVLKESIAMIDYGDPLYFFISFLGEFGVAESWTRLFSIGPLPEVVEPIGVGKNGDIFYLNGIEEVERFNLNTDMIEKVGVKGRHECCQMVIYN